MDWRHLSLATRSAERSEERLWPGLAVEVAQDRVAQWPVQASAQAEHSLLVVLVGKLLDVEPRFVDVPLDVAFAVKCWWKSDDHASALHSECDRLA